MSPQRLANARARVALRVAVALSVVGAVTMAAAQNSADRMVAASTRGGRVAEAQGGASAVEIINIRQQGFKKLGGAFKIIHNELSSSSPDATKIAVAAAEIKASTDAIAGWFPPGSGPQPGVKTHAKAEIWSDANGFAATRAAYTRQVEKSVRQLADPRERSVWKESSAALGQACKDCHDSYRVKG
jgi:cytochrome c556